MQVDTGAFQVLSSDVLARLDAIEARLERQAKIGAILAGATDDPEFIRPAPEPRRDRHGMRLVRGDRT